MVPGGIQLHPKTCPLDRECLTRMSAGAHFGMTPNIPAAYVGYTVEAAAAYGGAGAAVQSTGGMTLTPILARADQHTVVKAAVGVTGWLNMLCQLCRSLRLAMVSFQLLIALRWMKRVLVPL